jgi:hypothetical protein
MGKQRAFTEDSLESIATSVASIAESLVRFVDIEQQRLDIERQNIMPPAVIQALIDLLNKFVALVIAAPGNAVALADAQASLAALQSADASAAALVPSAQAAIDAANAALPPVVPSGPLPGQTVAPVAGPSPS